MIERLVEWEDMLVRVVFDRDAIVRAALRAFIEAYLACVDPLKRLHPVSCEMMWEGDLQRGAFFNGNGSGDHDIVAWTETGIVGLAYELGWGPLEQLGLSRDAVTGGPEDVRGAVPNLPAELEPAFLMAAGMIPGLGPEGQKDAGVGFWLLGDQADGSLFHDSKATGAPRLMMWGAVQHGRLPYGCAPDDAAAIAAENARRGATPVEMIVDAVTARALAGPTELTADEIATLLPSPPQPERLLAAQKGLQQVSVAWPGLSEIPPEPRPRDVNPFVRQS